jgi:outer membrane protein assembly factor BamB
LTWDRARSAEPLAGFLGEVAGPIYGQPLYWQPNNAAAGLLIIATEEDMVYALDADTGAMVWSTTLGDPVPKSALRCGNIDPLGITGTPAIDPSSGSVYLDAVVRGATGPQHLIFGLSLSDGSLLPGWPVNPSQALAMRGLFFNAPDQNQRGALTIAGGLVYVPYGGDYHGWIVGVPLNDPQGVISWHTRARGGGIWAPGGVSYDGQSLFVATGNTMGATQWADGEAVIRLGLDLARSNQTREYFAPPDWPQLDEMDADLGGTAPPPLDLPSSRGPVALLLALGKDGKAYLLDRQNLGGIGGALLSQRVLHGEIITAPAVFRSQDSMLVALPGQGIDCPPQLGHPGLTVLRIRAEPTPRIETAWCAPLDGAGAPIVTTSDDNGADPIVWIVGAEGDNRLHGYRGDTGEELMAGSGEPMEGLRHFATILAAEGHLYVPADGRIYAFGFSSMASPPFLSTPSFSPTPMAPEMGVAPVGAPPPAALRERK